MVTIEELKTFLGINNSPVILNFDINATANTLTRAAGSWVTAGVIVGSQLKLAGFSNATNNIIVTVTAVTTLVLTISDVASMVTETGNSLCTYRIEVTTYDSFLTEQELVVSESIEGYCGRVFTVTGYEQTFYPDDYDYGSDKLFLFHYPVTTVSSVLLGTEDIAVDIRTHKPTGEIKRLEGLFFGNEDNLVVTYEAGFATIPAPVRSVLFSLIEERYNKQISGISLNFGSDIQSVSIPGTISVAFDYTLQSNERKTAYGTILGNYVNILDSYRSERVLVGSGKLKYVELV